MFTLGASVRYDGGGPVVKLISGRVRTVGGRARGGGLAKKKKSRSQSLGEFPQKQPICFRVNLLRPMTEAYGKLHGLASEASMKFSSSGGRDANMRAADLQD